MGKKRANGQGNVTQLPSGTWRGQVMDGYTSTGKRHVVGFCGETKEDVLLALERFRAGL